MRAVDLLIGWIWIGALATALPTTLRRAWWLKVVEWILDARDVWEGEGEKRKGESVSGTTVGGEDRGWGTLTLGVS